MVEFEEGWEYGGRTGRVQGSAQGELYLNVTPLIGCIINNF
jgi:hypothetical protein